MPGYHSAGDIADRVRPETLTAMARRVIGTVVELAQRYVHAEQNGATA